jgi:transmembrane protein TMEM43
MEGSMPDSFTVTTSKSWFSRIAESIKSVLVGLILFVAAFPILFWNEGRAVKTARSLEEGAGAVVSVAPDSVVAANEGKLVHVTGPVATDGPVADGDLGVQADGVKLLRKVEMYQWKEEKKSETRKKLGGGEETVTTYEYKRDWVSEPVDSSAFQVSAGHENPGDFPLPSQTFVADPVRLGAFLLSEEQLDKLNQAQNLPVADAALESLPDGMREGAQVHNGAFYLGSNPAAPEIGDVRISFQVVKPATVSTVAVQSGSSFAPYAAEAGDTVLLVDEGTHTADEMFKSAQSANNVMTWILRGGGFFAMFLGLFLCFRPIAVLGDVVPLFGSLLGAGVGLFAFLVSAVLSFTTIAIAWITVRPLLGIALLVLAVGALAWLISANRKKKRMQAAQGGASMAA